MRPHDTTARDIQNSSSVRPLRGKTKMAKVHQKHLNDVMLTNKHPNDVMLTNKHPNDVMLTDKHPDDVMLTNKGWPSKKISFWLKYLAHYIFATT